MVINKRGMKRLLAFLLTVIMVLSLAACSGNTEASPSDSGNSAQPSNENPDIQETVFEWLARGSAVSAG